MEYSMKITKTGNQGTHKIKGTGESPYSGHHLCEVIFKSKGKLYHTTLLTGLKIVSITKLA